MPLQIAALIPSAAPYHVILAKARIRKKRAPALPDTRFAVPSRFLILWILDQVQYDSSIVPLLNNTLFPISDSFSTRPQGCMAIRPYQISAAQLLLRQLVFQFLGLGD
jgi:hypothetical protein